MERKKALPCTGDHRDLSGQPFWGSLFSSTLGIMELSPTIRNAVVFHKQHSLKPVSSYV
jgi:hypothetical protein